MGPRIYPSYQDTNLTAKGSLIINYYDIFTNAYNDYVQVTVNGQLRDRIYNKVDGLYRTNLNIGDVVLIELTSNIILFKNITVYRRDYTTDDNAGDNGITDTLITFNNSDTTTISLTFTATTVSDGYNFEYRVLGNVGTNPTQDCAINGLSFDYDGSFVIAGSIDDFNGPLQLSLNNGSVNSFNNITGNLISFQGATINFDGNIINYAEGGPGYLHPPNYSLNGGQTFATSSMPSYNDSFWTDMDCNIKGDYQIIAQTSGSLYISSNSGQTYTAISNSNKLWSRPVIPANNNGFPFYAITETVGDYLYKINSTTGVTQVTAAKAPTYTLPTVPIYTATTNFQDVAITPDGKYIALTYYADSGLVVKDFSFMLSSDSGNTFSFIHVTDGVYGCLMTDTKIAMSADGKYIYIVNDRTNVNYVGEFWYSHDFGATWVLGSGTLFQDKAGKYISCSATGKYVYKGINNNIPYPALYVSSDYGVTFSGDQLYGVTRANYAKPNKN